MRSAAERQTDAGPFGFSETAFCYVGDAAPLLAHLAAWPSLRTLHRPANLEDVFLKLTGRELRD